MKMVKKSMTMAVIVTAGALMAGLGPEASMAASKKARSAAKHPRAGSYASESSATERRLRALEDEISSLRAELNRTRSEARTQAQTATERVEAKQQQLEQQLAEDREHEESHHDLLFFRGGYAKMEHARSNELLLDNNIIGSTSDPKDGEGWYVGAGFDHRLTDDLWGITDMAAVDGEVMFEYKNFGSSHNALVDAAGTSLATGTSSLSGGVTVIKNQLTQFTLTASPKIKFNNLGDFRPWIIPFGLAIHVISPPSSGVTVLNPGLMLGTGAEYKIWKDLYAGVDFRYHFTGDDLDYKTKLGNITVLNKTDIDGLTAGAYLGFGF